MDEPNTQIAIIDPYQHVGEPCPKCGYILVCRCITTTDCVLCSYNGCQIYSPEKFCPDHRPKQTVITYTWDIPSETTLLDENDTADENLNYTISEVDPYYRRRLKTTMGLENVHFKIEYHGKRDDIDLYHTILKACDSDYPLDPYRKRTAQIPFCTTCHGMVWKDAALQPSHLKKAAAQVGIKIKVKRWVDESKCNKAYVEQTV